MVVEVCEGVSSCHVISGPISFLKSHLSSYFECVDTLDHLEVRLAEDSQQFNDSIDNLTTRIKSAQGLSDQAFVAIFNRRQKIEFYRQAIGVVQRFHYLFYILGLVHKNIQTRNYRVLMADYKKLKQLVSGGQVRVLQQVLRQVDEKLDELRAALHRDLQIMPGDVDKQIQICRNLSELEDASDAAWVRTSISIIALYKKSKRFW